MRSGASGLPASARPSIASWSLWEGLRGETLPSTLHGFDSCLSLRTLARARLSPLQIRGIDPERARLKDAGRAGPQRPRDQVIGPCEVQRSKPGRRRARWCRSPKRDLTADRRHSPGPQRRQPERRPRPGLSAATPGGAACGVGRLRDGQSNSIP